MDVIINIPYQSGTFVTIDGLRQHIIVLQSPSSH